MNLIYTLSILIALVVLILVLKYFLDKSEEDKKLPYKAKRYFFSRSEHEFLKILHEQIDTNCFLIFPKVRLADFVEVTAKGQGYQGWWNKIKSKHVDFLIWDVKNNNVSLVIELDGRSHNSKKMKDRDSFVDRLYSETGLQLKRVSVGSDFLAEAIDITKSLSANTENT